ncbi:MAG: ribosome hibernation-promoting factor, HPF/YfiA family [Flavobacteriales bacterium]
MQITIHSIHFDADQKLLHFINKKLEKLTQFDEELIFVEVYLKLENSENKSNKIVEVKVNTGNNDLFASKQCETFEEAIDLVQDIMIRQVKKNKQKKRSA